MTATARRLAVRLLNVHPRGRRLVMLARLTRYLDRSGWFRSIDDGLPLDADGVPLPWYTYASIRFLDRRIRPTMKVFEYGSGHSTIWWSQRVASVVSCEHDKSWFQKISAKLPGNVDYRYCAMEYGGQYCRIITSFVAEFDCVVIDGRDRVNCAGNALAALKEDGVIVWDNTERKAYDVGCASLEAAGFSRLDLWGLGPLSADEWCTSIFYRKGNCLGI